MSKFQCQGYTKAGEPCQKYAQDGSDFCYLHKSVEDRNYSAALENTATVTGIKTQIEQAESKLAQFEARGEQVEADARNELKERVHVLQAQLDKAREQLGKMQTVGSSAVNDVWNGYVKAWRTLSDGLNELRSAYGSNR